MGEQVVIADDVVATIGNPRAMASITEMGFLPTRTSERRIWQTRDVRCASRESTIR